MVFPLHVDHPIDLAQALLRGVGKPAANQFAGGNLHCWSRVWLGLLRGFSSFFFLLLPGLLHLILGALLLLLPGLLHLILGALLLLLPGLLHLLLGALLLLLPGLLHLILGALLLLLPGLLHLLTGRQVSRLFLIPRLALLGNCTTHRRYCQGRQRKCTSQQRGAQVIRGAHLRTSYLCGSVREERENRSGSSLASEKPRAPIQLAASCARSGFR